MAKKKVAKRQSTTAEYMLLYRLKKSLGENGSGIVFNALHGSPAKKQAALKRIENYLKGRAQPALKTWLADKQLALQTELLQRELNA